MSDCQICGTKFHPENSEAGIIIYPAKDAVTQSDAAEIRVCIDCAGTIAAAYDARIDAEEFLNEEPTE